MHTAKKSSALCQTVSSFSFGCELCWHQAGIGCCDSKSFYFLCRLRLKQSRLGRAHQSYVSAPSLLLLCKSCSRPMSGQRSSHHSQRPSTACRSAAACRPFLPSSPASKVQSCALLPMLRRYGIGAVMVAFGTGQQTWASRKWAMLWKILCCSTASCRSFRVLTVQLTFIFRQGPGTALSRELHPVTKPFEPDQRAHVFWSSLLQLPVSLYLFSASWQC